MPIYKPAKIRNQLHGLVPADIKKPILRLWEEASKRDDAFREGLRQGWNDYYFSVEDDVLIEGYKNQLGFTIFGEGIYVVTNGKSFDVSIYHGYSRWHKTVKEFNVDVILDEFEQDMHQLKPMIRDFKKNFLEALDASMFDLYISVAIMNDKNVVVMIETDEDYELRRAPVSIPCGTMEEFARLDAAKIAEDFLYQETN